MASNRVGGIGAGQTHVPGSRHISPTSSRTHILIDDNPAQQYVAAVRPSLSRTHTQTNVPNNSMSADAKRMSQSNSLNARYERALQEPRGLHSSSSEQAERVNTSNQAPGEDTSGESTESDEDFDWDQSDESELDEQEKEIRQLEKTREITERHEHHIKRAKRLRKVYLALMRLSRPIRTALFLVIGTGVAIT